MTSLRPRRPDAARLPRLRTGPWGLRGRAIAFFATVVTLTAGSVAGALLWRNYGYLVRVHAAHLTHVAQMIADAVAPSLLSNGTDELLRQAVRAVDDDDPIVVAVHGRDGRICARYASEHGAFEADPLPIPVPPDPSAAPPAPVARQTRDGLHVVVPVYESSGPVPDGPRSSGAPEVGPPAASRDTLVGYVSITHGLAPLRRVLLSRAATGALIALAAVACATLAIVTFVGQVVRPVEELADAARAIAAGDLTRRASAPSVGEVGTLARAFNEMAERLERSRADVEATVRRRTAELETRTRELEAQIAERQRVERALNDTRQFNATLVDSIDGIVWESDAGAGRFRFVSARAEHLLGYPVRRWLTEPGFWLAHLHPDDRGWVADFCSAAVERGRNYQLEYRMLAADGRTVWLRDVVSVVTAPGRPPALRGVMIDVSEAKRVEAELRRAKAAAEEASRAKSAFLANMSHEIRTPMTAMIGFAETLTECDLTPQEREAASAAIRRNGQYLLRLVSDVLDLSAVEAGKLCVERVECSPAEIVETVCAMHRTRAAARGLDLTLRFDRTLPERVVSDPTRLAQILINLVGNAIKFTHHGRVHIDAGMLEPPGGASTAPGTLRIAVTDTGIGIARDQLERIFEPFTQADASVRRPYGGTGLGLSICRRLAGLLGGRIEVESTPGRGSSFTLYVPIEPAAPAAPSSSPPPVPSRAAPPPGPPSARLSGRVLLAEDGPDNQRLIRRLLERAGLEVHVAANGRIACDRALDAWRAGDPFDLILMDIQMPAMDGYSATRLLRAQGYRAPIVALTAHAMADDRRNSIEAGCDDHLAKPVDRAELLGLVARFVRVVAAESVDAAPAAVGAAAASPCASPDDAD